MPAADSWGYVAGLKLRIQLGCLLHLQSRSPHIHFVPTQKSNKSLPVRLRMSAHQRGIVSHHSSQLLAPGTSALPALSIRENIIFDSPRCSPFVAACRGRCASEAGWQRVADETSARCPSFSSNVRRTAVQQSGQHPAPAQPASRRFHQKGSWDRASDGIRAPITRTTVPRAVRHRITDSVPPRERLLLDLARAGPASGGRAASSSSSEKLQPPSLPPWFNTPQ
ncbi:hypothetical protein B0T14DRAFT_235902 [Immersiella caudata]|uniref:Uncharacterized protein n=1 Tax=Immersiella caudata TaxID=314043 RepID=A0AA39WSD7_9PEZI|nr:hypothetical protein B0T14DRAFT_235902 [Immersiella caudata]